MMPLESMQNTIGAFLVFMTSVALAGCQMGELIETIRLKLSRRAVCLTGAHFLGGFVVMFLLLQVLRVLDQDPAGLAEGLYPMFSREGRFSPSCRCRQVSDGFSATGRPGFLRTPCGRRWKSCRRGSVSAMGTA